MTSSDDNLTALLGALRDAESTTAAPARVEAAVMRAWDASHAPRLVEARLSAASWFGSLAAAAVLSVGLTVVGGRLRSTATVGASLAAEASPMVILVGAPVLDGEQVRLVRMRMPASALHALGVTSTGAADVDVDVIVGEDGVARALRLNP